MHNDVLSVATLAKIDKSQKDTQDLVTRYFMAQFWCEFTKEVLTEFLNEDFLIKEMNAAKERKAKARQRTAQPGPQR